MHITIWTWPWNAIQQISDVLWWLYRVVRDPFLTSLRSVKAPASTCESWFLVQNQRRRLEFARGLLRNLGEQIRVLKQHDSILCELTADGANFDPNRNTWQGTACVSGAYPLTYITANVHVSCIGWQHAVSLTGASCVDTSWVDKTDKVNCHHRGCRSETTKVCARPVDFDLRLHHIMVTRRSYLTDWLI